MRSLMISTDSINKQRQIAKQWSGDDFTVEWAPFIFEVKHKKGCFVHLSAAWAHVDHLPTFVTRFLDSLDEYVLHFLKNGK